MTSKAFPSSLPACTGGPLLSDHEWEQRTARIAAIKVAVDARSPRWCPDCGSREIAPMFWTAADVFGCDTCGALISGRGD